MPAARRLPGRLRCVTLPAMSVFAFLLILGVVLSLALMVSAIRDLALNRALGATAKAVWVLIILSFPVLGSIAYLLIGRSQQDVAPAATFADPAGWSEVELAMETDQLQRAHAQLAAGEITQQQFDTLKTRIAASPPGSVPG